MIMKILQNYIFQSSFWTNAELQCLKVNSDAHKIKKYVYRAKEGYANR
jgi:hypothetical protein